jgi:hypothetical protein
VICKKLERITCVPAGVLILVLLYIKCNLSHCVHTVQKAHLLYILYISKKKLMYFIRSKKIAKLKEILVKSDHKYRMKKFSFNLGESFFTNNLKGKTFKIVKCSSSSTT